MRACPKCGAALARAVMPEGQYPIFSACDLCGYPLSMSGLLERVRNEKVTDVVRGSVFGTAIETMEKDEGVEMLERFPDLSFAAFEDRTAIGFRVENDLIVFNFGAPGNGGRFLAARREDPD